MQVTYAYLTVTVQAIGEHGGDPESREIIYEDIKERVDHWDSSSC